MAMALPNFKHLGIAIVFLLWLMFPPWWGKNFVRDRADKKVRYRYLIASHQDFLPRSSVGNTIFAVLLVSSIKLLWHHWAKSLMG